MSTQTISIYGIKTCDTCRKALKWLDAEGLDYDWIDLRKGDGIPAELVSELVKADEEGRVKAINKSSKTWRDLDNVSRETFLANTLENKTEFLLENPLLIKRPIVNFAGEVSCGFTPELMTRLKS